MKVTQTNCMFIMIDIQEKFRTVINNFEAVVKNCDILNRASEILEIPVLITEQYPEALGKTCSEIFKPKNHQKKSKKTFSIFNDEINELVKTHKKDILVIYGIETHICVAQSALDAISKGYQVHLITDAVSSRKEENKQIAIRRLEKAGVNISSTEMLLFEILQTAEHKDFRKISKLIK